MNAPLLTEIESLDELTTNPDVILPKLDGCFGSWDNERRTYVSKRDNVFYNPSSHNIELPSGYENLTLVGELLHEKGFQQTCRTIRKESRDNSWSGVSFNVFDVKTNNGCDRSFLERRILLDTLFRDSRFTERNLFVRKVRTVPYDRVMAESLFTMCRERNFEGLVLRQHSSTWSDKVHGWKWKIVRDMEGEVIGYTPGVGRLQGLLGSYTIKTSVGHSLSVGSGLTDEQRRKPHPIGTIITFRYRGTSEEGTPLKPTYKGLFVS